MRILAIDYGDSRTGLAYCLESEAIASPLETLFEKSPEKRFKRLLEAISENKSELVVVGHPINMDGSAGPRAKMCEELAEKLERESGVKTVLWDERDSERDECQGQKAQAGSRHRRRNPHSRKLSRLQTQKGDRSVRIRF